MKTRVVVAGVLGLVFASSSAVQGAEMSEAVTSWLNGDDAAALPALARDASGGDVAAQLLLGQIDRDTIAAGFSDYVLGLTRAERAALLRAPGASRSVNWLLALTDPTEATLGHAVFWYEAHLDLIESAILLQIEGENAAAEYTLWRVLMNGRFDRINALPAENHGLADAGFLNWIRAYFSNPNKAITMNGLIADTNAEKVQGLLALKRLERPLGLRQHFSDGANEFIEVVQGNGHKLAETSDVITLNDNLRRMAEIDRPLAVVRNLCSTCPQAAQDFQCMIETFEIVKGYSTLMSLRTPVENVVPAEVYITSDRAVADLKNLIKGRAEYHPRPIRSSCIAGFIAGDY